MRRHLEVPFETIQILCHQLECQPGDILDATTVYTIPAKDDMECTKNAGHYDERR